MTPHGALVGLQVRLTRRVAVIWLVLVPLIAVTVVRSYESVYSTAQQRLQFAEQFGANVGLQAIYGRAFDLTTTGGFTAWRFGGLVGVIVMLWGLFTVVRLTRTEEQTGHHDLVAVGGFTARQILVSAVAVSAGWQIVNGLVLGVALRSVGLAWRGSLVLAGTLAALGIAGVAIGAASAQLWLTRGRALGRGGLIVGSFTLVRIVADGSTSRTWLRWLTPNGWAEETRAFTTTQQLWPIALIAALSASLLGAALVFVARRDVGDALRPDRDSGPPVGGLHSLAALEVRLAARSAAGWLLALVTVGLATGMLASDIAKFARESPAESDAVRKFGIADLGRPQGTIGLMFALIVTVVIAVYAARTVSAAADSETDGLADHLLVQPTSRARWLLVHASAAIVAIAVVALATGAAAWAAMLTKPDAITLSRALGAGANLVPLAVLVIGIGTLVHAIAPRAATPCTLGLVIGGFLIEFVGSITSAPRWLRDTSPFHHIAPYPAADIRPVALLVLVAIGAGSLLLAVIAVNHRDITTR